MSEEILKALMQLFAIIAKQDGILILHHDKYVRDFLASQLGSDRVNEYLSLYFEYLGDPAQEQTTGADSAKSRTSMKDSVRTLAICKKINKTLTQKQKVIVLIRLIEFFKNDSGKSFNRQQIVETVAEVFNIEKTEFLAIRKFILENQDESGANDILIGDESRVTEVNCRKFIPFHNYNGVCKFHFIKSLNIIILKYQGQSDHFLNGLLIKPEYIYIFPQGSTLRLPQTTIYFSNIISGFTEDNSKETFNFDAHIIRHVFPNGKQGLHELKINETSGNLIGIMGASGSGKTTLLTLLSGQENPTEGEIRINNEILNKNNTAHKGLIGFVPQDDLLLEDLTVYQNLYYNARLCFKDISEEEVETRITKTLNSLGLDEIKDIKVGNALNKKISGGQRKRLNIALELMREPHILFLDEPTSGLSSRDSENVMDLLKELAIKGKLIFVVIHQPSSDIFKMFDKLLILDTGGFAAYYGNPIEGVMYFKRITNQINCEVGECHSCGSVNPETIFNLMELKEINEYGTYTDKRKITPPQFYNFYKDSFLSKIKPSEIIGKLENKFSLPGILTQTKYFFLRDFFSKLANKQYILINLLEVPLLVTFLALIIRYIDKSKSDTYSYFHNYNLPAFIFMSIIAALLVGLTISAEEIFKDQKILKREKFLHLSRFSYLLSKVVLLFGISIIQAILYVLIGHYILDISIGHVRFFLVLFSVFAFANIFGLILSSTFNSPVTIYVIIPLIIIPQMLLGGAMFNYSKLNEWLGGESKVPYAANFMVSRWAYEALAVDMFINNPMEKDKFQYDKLESKLNYKTVYFIPKLEELLNAGDSTKKIKENKHFELIQSEISKDNIIAKKLGFQQALPSFENIKDIRNYLKELNHFYNSLFNSLSDQKEKFVRTQIKKTGDAALYNSLKFKYQNNQLEEICTSALEKNKILASGGRLIQVIDPVFKEPETEGNLLGLSTHFLSATKTFFGKQVNTFYYNLLFIWIINFGLFYLLYTDALKKLLDKFN